MILLWSDYTSQCIRTTWARHRGRLASQRAQEQSDPSTGCVSIVDFVNLLKKISLDVRWSRRSNNGTQSSSALDSTKVLPIPVNWSSKSTDTPALSSPEVSWWLKMFKDGQEEVTNIINPGGSSTSDTDENITRLRNYLSSYHRISAIQTIPTCKECSPGWSSKCW